MRGETCLKRPPTPTFDDLGPEPEYTVDEEVETNVNNNAKEDSDTSDSESEEEDPEPPETKKPKMDAAISSKPVKPAAIKNTRKPPIRNSKVFMIQTNSSVEGDVASCDMARLGRAVRPAASANFVISFIILVPSGTYSASSLVSPAR